MFEHLKSNFEKFKDFPFRPYQEDAIRFALESDKPIVVIEAPTGFGKSLTYMCIGAHHKTFTALVASKQLQSQLHHDFPTVRTMFGRNNFECLHQTAETADHCVHDGKLFVCRHKLSAISKWKNKTNPEYQSSCEPCPYEDRKLWVLDGDYRLLNYHYFLFESNYVGRFSNANLLICDEGDLLEGLLTDFITLTITGKMVYDFSLDPPPRKTATAHNAIELWQDWAKEIYTTVGKKLKDSYLTKDLREKYEGLYSRLEIFITHVDKSWIFEEIKPQSSRFNPTYKFYPTWITEALSQQYFFRHAQKFIITSATFPPKAVMGKLLGRHPGDFDYFEASSSFPVKSRPVYISRTANLTAETYDEEAPKIIGKIIDISAENLDHKGIIHAVSYKLSDFIMAQGLSRFITHTSKNREQIISKFKEDESNLILVSPSIERGIDLPQDECRFIIIAKCPFMYLGDKLTKARTYSGKVGSLWYRSMAAQTMVQMCGRGMRSHDDYCKTYIIDSQAVDLILKERSLFPSWFLEAVEVE